MSPSISLTWGCHQVPGQWDALGCPEQQDARGHQGHLRPEHPPGNCRTGGMAPHAEAGVGMGSVLAGSAYTGGPLLAMLGQSRAQVPEQTQEPGFHG